MFLDIRPVPGQADEWILCTDWTFSHDDIKQRTIKRGFVFDLMSIPIWAISLVMIRKTDRRAWPAALEHDYRYHFAIGPRQKADRALRQGLRAAGFNALQCWAVYLAVRVAGRRYWANRVGIS